MTKALNDNDLKELRQIIVDCEIACPISGTKNWTDVRQFNLMFSTQLGNVDGGVGTIYLRPETAQGIFVNFLNVQKTGRMKVPFGIAQIGKAFRNEIVARQFIFRMREFEQMEAGELARLRGCFILLSIKVRIMQRGGRCLPAFVFPKVKTRFFARYRI